MPQASDELRAEMQKYFGDPVDDAGPTQYLKFMGHVLTSNWQWKLKEGKTLQNISTKEFLCIKFLVDEWDFGGIHL